MAPTKTSTPVTAPNRSRFGLLQLVLLPVFALVFAEFFVVFRMKHDVEMDTATQNVHYMALRSANANSFDRAKLDAILGRIESLGAKFQCNSASEDVTEINEVNEHIETLIEMIKSISTQNSEGNIVSLGTTKSENLPYQYDQSPLEQHFIDNAEEFGLHEHKLTPTCPLIFNKASPIHDDLQSYFLELDTYNKAMKNYQPFEHDLRHSIEPGEGNIEQVCSILKIHPKGLEGIFTTKGHLSSSNSVGYMEPLLPVMRSHKICDDAEKHLFDMDHIIHDFYSICKMLKRHSRTVFVDMGASGGGDSYINKVFSTFGIKFDHIYAFEVKHVSPGEAYKEVSIEKMDAFHWINLGVDPELGSKFNPFTLLLNRFDSDDLIVVKLDVDAASIEGRFVNQLRNDSKLLEIIDLFYFEHHRLQKEMYPFWSFTAQGSVGESLDMMAELRAKGVASHYWV